MTHSDTSNSSNARPEHMRAVLWDMDGVLVHSADYHYAAWKAALAPESIDLTRVAFERTFGQRNDTVLRDLISPDIGASEIARIAALKEDLYRQFVRTHGIQPLDGVLHWLEKLTAQGWRHAVASAAPRGNVDCILEVTGMEHYFGAITSAEDVTRGKPDPQVYLLAAERVATPPTQCIVVEDAPAGLQGARSAGIKCIGVLTTHPHLDADIVVRSLSDLGDDAFAQLIH